MGQKDPTVVIRDSDGNVVQPVVPNSMPVADDHFQVRRRHTQLHTVYEIYVPNFAYRDMPADIMGQLQSVNLVTLVRGLARLAKWLVEERSERPTAEKE